MIRFPSEKRAARRIGWGDSKVGMLRLFGGMADGGSFGAGFFEALVEAAGQVGGIVVEGAGGFRLIEGLPGLLGAIHGYVEKAEAAQAFVGDLGIGDGLAEALFGFGVAVLRGVKRG